MTRLFLLVLLAACAFADVSVDTLSFSRSMRAGGPYPWISTVAPKKGFFTITSTDSWVLTKTGSMLNYTLRNATTGSSVSSGSGNLTVAIDFNGVGIEALTVGNHTGGIKVNPSTGDDVDITLSIDVLTREAYTTFEYPATFPVGCTNTNANYPHADTCDIPNEYPPASGFSIPAVGASYVDPAFGRTVTRVTGAGNGHSYSTRTAFNADSTYLMLDDGNTLPDIWRLSDNTKIHTDEPGNLNAGIWWHWSDPNKYIYISGAEVFERTLGGPSTSLANFSGSPWNFTNLWDKGTNDITSDGWIGLINEGTTDACLLDLNGLTSANKATKIFCVDYAAESLSDVDFPLVWTADAVTGKRYFALISAPRQVWYEHNVGAGTVDELGNFGEWPGRGNTSNDDGICDLSSPTENCFTEPHTARFSDARGAHLVQTFDEVHGNRGFLASILVSKGANMWRPVEETGGGGLRLHYPNGGAAQDKHFGASDAGWFVASYYGDSAGLATKVILSATAANPSRVVTTAAHGWSTGQMTVTGSSNFPCLNIASTITVINTTTFDVDSANCTGAGTYNANSGIVAVGTTTTDEANRQEVVIVNPILNKTIRLAHHRTKIWADTSGADVNVTAYRSSPKCSISRLADKVACGTNFGVVEGTSEIVIATGISAAPTTGVRVSGGTTIGGGTTLR